MNCPYCGNSEEHIHLLSNGIITNPPKQTNKPVMGKSYNTGFFNPRGKWIAYPVATMLRLEFLERMQDDWAMRARFLMTGELPDQFLAPPDITHV